jgi:cobalt-zinc-cadmium efflux system membrane fusion protein
MKHRAMVCCFLAALSTFAAHAAPADAPHRLPDGSLFLPEPTQRQIGVRTSLTKASELPRSVELFGKVVMDPNAGGKVQPMVSGRIESAARGLPGLGQSVKKGELLAYVVPSMGQIERSNQAAQLAELRAARGLTEKRLARLKELSDTVPRKEIEAAESELASLTERVAAVGGGLSSRERLIAPVSGVISAASVVAGQVVESRDLVFEIVDPNRLRIEAVTFDVSILGNMGRAALALGDERIPLTFIGAARSLREQALPLAFRAEGPALARLVVGQPVKLVVETRTRVLGVAVPAAAVMKNAANQNVVWVKTAPERFEPRVVMVEPLDGVNVAVVSGLKGEERVVVAGAALINQVR